MKQKIIQQTITLENQIIIQLKIRIEKLMLALVLTLKGIISPLIWKKTIKGP